MEKGEGKKEREGEYRKKIAKERIGRKSLRGGKGGRKDMCRI